jgi:hypothetical protein
VLLSVRLLFEHKLLSVKDLFVVRVANHDPEGLSGAVILRIPSEILGAPQFQLDPQHGPRDWLNVGFELKPGKFVDVGLDSAAHFRHAHDLAELLRRHFVKVLPLKLSLLLKLPDNFVQVWHLGELAQRRHRGPLLLFDNFAQIQQFARGSGPLLFERNFEKRSENTASILTHVNNVRVDVVAVQ